MIDDLRLVVIETEAQHIGITSKDANRSVTRITKKSKRRISLQLEESFENYTEKNLGQIGGKSPKSASDPNNKNGGTPVRKSVLERAGSTMKVN